MESTANSLTFKVWRKEPELIAPAKPTPHEFKLLSDIDDQESLRFHVPGFQFFRRNPAMEGKDPAEVIRGAIAKALVFYYPLAGRLRERAGKKLVVECTGEGVLFIEADADVALHEFGDAIQPPIPCAGELLYDVPGSGEVLDSPLFLIQVTRLKCGGFIFGCRFNHTMCDGEGLFKFLSAIGELACGADAPSILPVWNRHLLNARNPPRVTCTHHEHDDPPETAGTLIPEDGPVYRSFFFGAAEFAALRSRLPAHLRDCSRFELLTACLWRCRTVAVSPELNEEVRIMFLVNSRGRFDPPLPAGYYGNAIAFPVAVATAGELMRNPLHYAVELVRKARAEVTEEYMRSLADLTVIRGRPFFMIAQTFVVSDLTRAGLDQADYGWGKPVYGGPAETGGIPTIASNYLPCKNTKGIVVPMCLPSNAMEVLSKGIEAMLSGGDDVETGRKNWLPISRM